jgi:predicted  nucleic acid-binding Zn-ribbon protein
MASVSSEPVGADAATHERLIRLEAELRRSERRREAAEQWATLLEGELERQEQHLEDVIVDYERRLEDAKRGRSDGGGGLWAAVTAWF